RTKAERRLKSYQVKCASVHYLGFKSSIVMFKPQRPLRTGIAIACISGCVFTAIAIGALVQGPVVSLDNWIALDMRDADHAGIIQALMIALTSLGSVLGMTLLCSCGVAWHFWRGPAHRR